MDTSFHEHSHSHGQRCGFCHRFKEGTFESCLVDRSMIKVCAQCHHFLTGPELNLSELLEKEEVFI